MWTKLATDLFHFESNNYLLMVDYTLWFQTPESWPQLHQKLSSNRWSQCFLNIGYPKNKYLIMDHIMALMYLPNLWSSMELSISKLLCTTTNAMDVLRNTWTLSKISPKRPKTQGKIHIAPYWFTEAHPSAMVYHHQWKYWKSLHLLTYLWVNSDKVHYINRGIWLTSVYVQVLCTIEIPYKNNLHIGQKGTPVMVYHTAKKIWEKGELSTSIPNQKPMISLLVEACTTGQHSTWKLTPQDYPHLLKTHRMLNTVTEGEMHDIQHNTTNLYSNRMCIFTIPMTFHKDVLRKRLTISTYLLADLP